MGVIWSKQPNAKFCRFSTIVDTVTNYNLSEDEVRNYIISEAIEQAKERAEKIVSGDARSVYDFESMVDMFVPNNDTVNDFNKLLKEMGSDIKLDPKNYDIN